MTSRPWIVARRHDQEDPHALVASFCALAAWAAAVGNMELVAGAGVVGTVFMLYLAWCKWLWRDFPPEVES